eukprot:6459356-Amphidinium_carterae.1
MQGPSARLYHVLPNGLRPGGCWHESLIRSASHHQHDDNIRMNDSDVNNDHDDKNDDMDNNG